MTSQAMKHHEFSSLFPMLGGDELQALAADIKKHGQHDPIITLHGEILDGRNRFAACGIAGTEPWLQAYQGDDPLGYVVSHNLHRRHLTESQRGMVASKLATMRVGNPSGANQHKRGTPPIGEIPPITKQTRQEAAAALNVGTTTLDRARSVQKHGVKELTDAVEAGKIKLGSAEAIAKMPSEAQRALIASGITAVPDGRKKDMAVPSKRILRLPAYIPNDAREIWLQAKITLERILHNDKHRVVVLNEIISYCETRLNTNK